MVPAVNPAIVPEVPALLFSPTQLVVQPVSSQALSLVVEKLAVRQGVRKFHLNFVQFDLGYLYLKSPSNQNKADIEKGDFVSGFEPVGGYCLATLAISGNNSESVSVEIVSVARQ